MKHTSSTDLRKNLSALMDEVNDDHEPLLITRANGKPVVMLSVEDYQAMDETAYLLASPENARRLRLSIDQIEQDHTIAKSADDLDALAGE